LKWNITLDHNLSTHMTWHRVDCTSQLHVNPFVLPSFNLRFRRPISDEVLHLSPLSLLKPRPFPLFPLSSLWVISWPHLATHICRRALNIERAGPSSFAAPWFAWAAGSCLRLLLRSLTSTMRTTTDRRKTRRKCWSRRRRKSDCSRPTATISFIDSHSGGITAAWIATKVRSVWGRTAEMAAIWCERATENRARTSSPTWGWRESTTFGWRPFAETSTSGEGSSTPYRWEVAKDESIHQVVHVGFNRILHL